MKSSAQGTRVRPRPQGRRRHSPELRQVAVKAFAPATSWHPEKCESCHLPFGPEWEQDYALSGERIYRCSGCLTWAWPPIDKLEAS